MEELQNCVKISNNIYFTWVSFFFFFSFSSLPPTTRLSSQPFYEKSLPSGAVLLEDSFCQCKWVKSICYSTYGVCISRKPFFILILFVDYMHNCISRIFHDKFNYLIQWNHEKNFLEWQVGSLRCENDYSIALLVVTGLL